MADDYGSSGAADQPAQKGYFNRFDIDDTRTGIQSFAPLPGTADAGSEVLRSPDKPNGVQFVFSFRRDYFVKRRATQHQPQNAFVTKDSSEEPIDFRGIPPSDDPKSELQIRRLCSTAVVNAVRPTTTTASQTPYFRKANAAIQAEPTVVDAGHFAPDQPLIDPSTGLPMEPTAYRRLAKFLERVEPRTLHHMTQNTEVPIFADDYANLTGEDTFVARGEDSFLQEKGNFTHPLTMGREVSCVDWRSSKGRDDVVVVSTVAIYKGGMLERFQQQQHCNSSFSLVWDMGNPMHPRFILESQYEVTVIRFNPSRPNIIVGACMNGQILVWDTDRIPPRIALQMQQSSGGAAGRRGGAGGAGGSSGGAGGGAGAMASARRATVTAATDDGEIPEMEAPVPGHSMVRDGDTWISKLKPYQVSRIEATHKHPIHDICWVPEGLEFATDGKMVPSTTTNQFATISDDGYVAIWDLRPEFLPQDRQRTLRQKSKGAWEGRPWVYLHKHQLSRPDGSGDVFGMRIAMDGRKDKPPTYRLAVTSLDGEFCLCSIAPKEERLVPMSTYDSAAAADAKRVIRQLVKGHAGPGSAVQRHPTIPDIYLTCGDWCFKVWRAGVASPILTSPVDPQHPSQKITCARWSPTRPSVLFCGTSDGLVQVWDLLDRTHEAVLSHQLLPHPVTCVEFKPLPERRTDKFVQHLLFGTREGSFHWFTLPRSLTRGPTNERTMMENMLSREVRRVVFMEWRWQEREAEASGKSGVTFGGADAGLGTGSLGGFGAMGASKGPALKGKAAALQAQLEEELNALDGEYEQNDEEEEAFKRLVDQFAAEDAEEHKEMGSEREY